ncbi:MAG: PD-(D/E)XK nuclease family protein [Bacteriovoracaceae bacterium]|nr:PD-(D/E)XK nuclease family protein [Bacteriovoracaceae bacterium]
MLRIMLFNQTDNLYEQGLATFDDALIVTPSPQVADIIRRKLTGINKSFDVVTISKFLRDELTLLVGDEVSENYRGKSDLLLLLSTLWKKLELEDASYELFQRCFHLLTDLRSFSMSDDVLETALEHFDPSIAFGTMRMHQILNQLDIYDEHRSYFQLSERLRSGDLPIDYETERNIVFFGFDFLSASQVDLLRSYAIRDNVVLPSYEKVYESLTDWDWLSWLDSEEVEKVHLDTERPVKKIKMTGYPKNYLSKVLKSTLEQHVGAPCQIIIGDRHPNFEKLQQTNLTRAKFKAPADILGDKINWLMDEIIKSDIELTDELIFKLEELIQESIEAQDFRAIKAIQLLTKIVTQWRDLSDDNEQLSTFDIKILKEVLSLDSPRVFQTSLGRDKFLVELKSLKELEDIQKDCTKILCVSSDFTSPKGSLTTYTEGVEKYLSSIGPLRRAELEFISLKEKVLDIMDDNTWALIEEGVLDRDQNWKNLFDSVEMENSGQKISFEKNVDYHRVEADTDAKASVYSATKIQTFIECPKKYYFKYILKYSPDYVYEDRMQALELGRVQHKVIEDYVNTFSSYTEQDHLSIVEKALVSALAGKKVSKTSRADYVFEAMNLTRLAIEQLLKLKAQGEIKVQFEQDLKQKGFRGSVDCVVETQDDLFLLDFKRGTGSIPSQKGFKSYEKVQLWFYANHWNTDNKNLCLGYVCLSEMESSTLYFDSSEFKDNAKGLFEAKAISLEKNFDELFEDYKKFETSTISRMETATDFKANPQAAKVCQYCDFNKMCSRSGEV